MSIVRPTCGIFNLKIQEFKQQPKKKKTVNDTVNFLLDFGAAVHCSIFSYELLNNFV